MPRGKVEKKVSGKTNVVRHALHTVCECAGCKVAWCTSQRARPSSCGGGTQVWVAVTVRCRRGVPGSFGDPRTRPVAAGDARRHSPSVHWWQQASERGLPKCAAREASV